MKTRPIRLAAVAIALAGSLSLGAFKSSADVAVSVGVQVNAVAEFHAPLAPHGTWVEVGSYGRCWRPSHVVVGWRPYCDGHWEWTDVGWYWVSDEPWAWATYHYGSWVYEPSGWFWVPAVEWAPAWVSWRVGGGHIGWAPYAPRGVVVAPSLFVFVDGPRFHERITPRTVIVNNTTIINKTTQINEVKRESRDIAGRPQQVVVNEGPGVETVQKITGKKFTPVPVQEVDRKTTVPAAVKRRTVDSPTKEAAPTTQEQKKAATEAKPDQPNKKTTTENVDKKSPQERPAKSDQPDKTSPPDKSDRPDRTPPPVKPDKPDKASPPDRPDRPPPAEKPDKPDRASPPSKPENSERAAPPPERQRPESPPQKSPGPSPGRERSKGKEKGPGG